MSWNCYARTLSSYVDLVRLLIVQNANIFTLTVDVVCVRFRFSWCFKNITDWDIWWIRIWWIQFDRKYNLLLKQVRIKVGNNLWTHKKKILKQMIWIFTSQLHEIFISFLGLYCIGLSIIILTHLTDSCKLSQKANSELWLDLLYTLHFEYLDHSSYQLINSLLLNNYAQSKIIWYYNLTKQLESNEFHAFQHISIKIELKKNMKPFVVLLLCYHACLVADLVQLCTLHAIETTPAMISLRHLFFTPIQFNLNEWRSQVIATQWEAIPFTFNYRTPDNQHHHALVMRHNRNIIPLSTNSSLISNFWTYMLYIGSHHLFGP